MNYFECIECGKEKPFDDFFDECGNCGEDYCSDCDLHEEMCREID